MDEQQNISSKYTLTDADYEKAELDLLRAALKRSYTERFLVMTKLMKRNNMFKKQRLCEHLIS